jgi:hypothetical protein
METDRLILEEQLEPGVDEVPDTVVLMLFLNPVV